MVEIAAAILFIIAAAVYFSGKKRASTRAPLHADRIYSPAAAARLLNYSLTSRHLTAMLLHLTLSGVLGVKKSAEKTVLYIRKEESLTSHEKYFLDWMFYEVGTEGEFCFEDVWLFTEKSRGRADFAEKMENWKGFVERDLELKNVIMKSSGSAWFLSVSGILLFVGGGAVIFNNPFSTIAMWTGGVLLVTAASKCKWLTAFGEEEKRRLQSYRNYLSIYTPPQRSIEELTTDYVFALTFGLEEDFEKEYPLKEASEIRIRQENFPLYMAAPGTAYILIEEENFPGDAEAVFTRALDLTLQEGQDFTNPDGTDSG
ncbi:DUF2207 family protein [Alkalicoccus halolimnae]|uniref:DUF2207 domain-containing protein n=1 Tax=Alkalicoccus halolimnae TaxID=1667239 RepID=A0A5C7FPI2_9BACI|nr:DUF2207 domain-containing protein [Alkalicoccus halolimnae]TXF87276.1 DUF2207 domain-containing protein [Alkalicoccus halolimnae]